MSNQSNRDKTPERKVESPWVPSVPAEKRMLLPMEVRVRSALVSMTIIAAGSYMVGHYVPIGPYRNPSFMGVVVLAVVAACLCMNHYLAKHPQSKHFSDQHNR